MSKPIVIRLPSGEEYGVASFATVEKYYPGAEVLRYQDGTEYKGKQFPEVQERLNEEARVREEEEQRQAPPSTEEEEQQAPPGQDAKSRKK